MTIVRQFLPLIHSETVIQVMHEMLDKIGPNAPNANPLTNGQGAAVYFITGIAYARSARGKRILFSR